MNEKDKPVLAGVPGAMCVYQNKLYLFFDKAYQVLSFEGEKTISSTDVAAWEHPSNCIAQDEYIWIAADNGLFTLHFDGQKHKVLHADACKDWAGLHAFGIYKDYIYAISNVVKQYDTSSGITKTVNGEDWSYQTSGFQFGNFLYTVSKRGPIWRYDMEKNSYEQVSSGWTGGKAATFVEDQLFIFADGIWIVDCEAKKKRQVRKENCDDIVCCTSLGKDVYAVKKDGTFWRYNLDVIETKIDLEWTTGNKTDTKVSVPQAKPTASISWNDGNVHHRLYAIENGKVVEYVKDGDRDWHVGSNLNAPGFMVAAVNWGNHHIRVYVQNETSITELAYESGWHKGEFKATGNLLAASVSSDGMPHVFVENNGAIKEWRWDRKEWKEFSSLGMAKNEKMPETGTMQS